MNTLTVTTEGTTLTGRVRGSGQVVVLLHGGPGCYDYLGESVLADWMTPFRTVVSYDQRGCRHSPSAGPFTMNDNVSDLEAVRKALGAEQVELIGHSAGAALAVHYLRQHPQAVRRAVLLSPAALRDGWRAAFTRTLESRMTEDQCRSVDEIDRALASTESAEERSELYRRRFEVMLPCYVDPSHRDRAPRMPYFNRAVNISASANADAGFLDASWRDAVRRSACLACIIHGRSDPVPLSVVQDYGAILPAATIHLLDSCGHFPWLELPDALRRLLFAFLGVPG